MEEEKYTYEVFEDGYDIYKNGELIITQRAPYDHVLIPDGTYEENAEAQIASLQQPVEPSEEEKLRADMDYIALMGDYDLPSYNEQEGE